MFRRCFFVFASALLPSISFAAAPSVFEKAGNIYCSDILGHVTALTDEGLDSAPVIAPDGKTVAFIRTEGKATQEDQPDFTALWLGECLSGQSRRLLGPKPGDDPKADLSSMSHPVFSLEGGYVYILASAWVTSDAIHQVNLKTGVERFVADGNTLAVIRNGPYRGYLLTSKHKYHDAPDYGSYDPDVIVRPDGKEILTVPGTDDDDGTALAAWLKSKGWTAW